MASFSNIFVLFLPEILLFVSCYNVLYVPPCLILRGKMLEKCSTAQSFIPTEMTIYRIGTLDVIIVFSLSGLSKPVITNHNFLAVYFDHRHKDLKLLLNLLAETSGLPESFRILTLFDKKFQSLWKPQNLRFEEYETVGSRIALIYKGYG